MVRTLKDLFAGAAGGIAQVLLGEFCLRISPIPSNRLCFSLSVRQFDITCLQKVRSYYKYLGWVMFDPRRIDLRSYASSLIWNRSGSYPLSVSQPPRSKLTRIRPTLRYRKSQTADHNPILQRS